MELANQKRIVDNQNKTKTSYYFEQQAVITAEDIPFSLSYSFPEMNIRLMIAYGA